MEFRILGPIEASSDGTPVNLGGPHQRAILAALLLDAGNVVPVTRLVDAAWGEKPPPTVRKQVQARISRLRAAFAAAGVTGDDIIETHPAGYRIALNEHVTLDAERFAALDDEGRRALAEGRLRHGADLLREALVLWRGPALAGLDGLAAESARLDEQRLAVQEECLRAELRLGRHAEVVPELSAFVAAHPLRERPRAQLMWALLACGRRAEALAAYGAGRALLVDELGIEPGPELRAAHQAALADPPSVPLPAFPVVTATAALAPRQAAKPPRRMMGAALGMVAVVLGLTLVGDAVVTAPQPLGPAETVQAGTRQYVPGPAWVNTPPRTLPRTFFGITVGSSSGAMPDFRVGAVRSWDNWTGWSNLQPERSRHAWGALDRVVDGAERAGLPVLHTIGLTPAWANPGGRRAPYPDGSRAAPPLDPADWDAYVRALATRYRGRIEAYELWDYPSSPYRWNGDMARLAELTRRAGRIIKESDPDAVVGCPSFGDLWLPEKRAMLRRFAEAGGYRACDAALVKLHPRRPDGPPEEMAELATLIDHTLHRAGVHLPMWATGPSHDITTVPPLGPREARAEAVRYYLMGLYIRYERMYFYSWGPRGIPLILQVEGGPPTQAAGRVQELQRLLDGARTHSCSRGTEGGLPAAVWECRFSVPRRGGGQEDVAVRWTGGGSATVPAGPGAYRLDRLDGTSIRVRPGTGITVGEEPVLVRSSV